ncbi:MAG TPA: GNAT family N-acetyltransferase [Candidatus Brocadiia bacterium]|nr:GNAT family N-acetyltransferase [Candidatus Brocadiia bacterium]
MASKKNPKCAEYRVDAAVPSDAADLAMTDIAAFAPWFGDGPPTDSEIEKATQSYRANLKRGAYVAVVRDSGGRAVGLIEAGGSKGSSWAIGTVAVHPDHRGRNLGGMLLAEAEREARKRGLSVITLSTMNRYRGMVLTAFKAGFDVYNASYDGSRGDYRLLMVKDLRLKGV